MSESDQEDRTEDATEKRRKEAAEKGQIVRSKDWNTLVCLMSASVGLTLFSPAWVQALSRVYVSCFSFDMALLDKHSLLAKLGQHFLQTVWMLAPFFLMIVILTLLGAMVIGGPSFSTSNFMPKFEKLNPFTGLMRMFSMKSLIELGKSCVKLLLIIFMSYLIGRKYINEVLVLAFKASAVGMKDACFMLCKGFFYLTCSMVLVAAIDVPVQFWEFIKQLKMTKQEVREEMKEAFGNPEMKGRIKQLQRDMASGRMMNNVADANVVLTNPTHYSVALRYDPATMVAPLVVAKGADIIAAQIRKVADAHQVPIVSTPPLARTLYHFVKLDQPVPKSLYVAVARILAYVYELKLYSEGRSAKPDIPIDLPIPDELTK